MNLARKWGGRPSRLLVEEHTAGGSRRHRGKADMIDNDQQGVLWIRGSFKGAAAKALKLKASAGDMQKPPQLLNPYFKVSRRDSTTFYVSHVLHSNRATAFSL